MAGAFSGLAADEDDVPFSKASNLGHKASVLRISMWGLAGPNRLPWLCFRGVDVWGHLGKAPVVLSLAFDCDFVTDLLTCFSCYESWFWIRFGFLVRLG